MSEPNLPPPTATSLLTATEVAQKLKLSVRSVRRLIADGRLPVARLGRSVRIRPEALAALIGDE
jgi:excisionase family DNA binding protein